MYNFHGKLGYIGKRIGTILSSFDYENALH